MFSRIQSFGVLAVSLALVGCNSQPANVTVSGKVLEGDKPLVLSPTGVVQVTLLPDVPEGTEFTTYVGRCNPDGSFEVIDVPVGKYKIGVEQLDPTPMEDKLKGAHSVANTKIIRDIDGKSPIVVDLAKP